MPSKLVVRCFSVSADGYGAGPNQDIDNPMGVGGMALHEWVLPTQFFQKKLFNKDGGTTGPDNDFAVRGFENIGAWILGRNMFGPVRGTLARRQLEGLVGRRAALSLRCLRADASRPSTARNERRHGIPLRDRWDRGGLAARPAVGGKQGYQARRRRGDDPGISLRAPRRRDAYCDCACPARIGRESVCEHRSAAARLQATRACRNRQARRTSCSPEQRTSNPPAPDTAPPAARRDRRRRGRARRVLRQDRRRSSGPRRPRPASPPSSAPGCAGTSAPR